MGTYTGWTGATTPFTMAHASVVALGLIPGLALEDHRNSAALDHLFEMDLPSEAIPHAGFVGPAKPVSGFHVHVDTDVDVNISFDGGWVEVPRVPSIGPPRVTMLDQGYHRRYAPDRLPSAAPAG